MKPGLGSSLLVALGAALGANARYWTGYWVTKWLGDAFPTATLAINLIGSLGMGLLMGFLTRQSNPDPMRVLVGVGILGGFTTFSAFSWELLQLFRKQGPASGFAYIFLSVFGGLLLAYAGHRLTARQ